MNSKYDIRGAMRSDAIMLADLDAKHDEYPWSGDEWAGFVKSSSESGVSLACRFSEIVGFVVFKQSDDGHDTEIAKLVVKPAYRREGIGRMLLESVEAYAAEKKHERIVMVVPESQVYPPNAAGHFLAANAFKVKRPFIRNRFSAYGRFEDGVEYVCMRP